MQQRTLAAPFTVEGVGIHTGVVSRVTAHPADTDTGRVFQTGRVLIPARAEYVVDTARCTTLGSEGARISTVEHLLSALMGFSIDNALIVVEGPEIPILDGSALPFVEAIRSAGVREQTRAPRVLTLEAPLELHAGNGSIRAMPAASTLELEVTTDFADWREGDATLTAYLEPEDAEAYAAHIAPARTFAFQQEVDALLAAGLAKGGSLDNALIITPPDGFSRPLRLPSEWCAHKMLDLLGDLALTDRRLQIHVAAIRPGHTLNTRFAAALLAQSPPR
ncbi:MAG TPA: UDP-3-O-acyl-N-acetylglucosamine deacetylase [Chthonomonadaceae bacterium]|nr:UDP-3-O-acyl-N-acetylglucosamine deacetylase [Chthonomonadaceae bacterium]